MNNEVQVETKKYGIANLLPIIMLGAEIGNVCDAMGRTKGIARYFHLTSLFDEVVDIMSVDFKQVKLEVKDLDAEEKNLIREEFKKKFDIKNDNLEEVIEDSISVIEDALNLIDKSKNIYQKIKTLKSSNV